MSSAVRPQFAQWLLEQVQSGHYDGLYMIDRDKFRIPWKHNSRKDCGDEDNRIFRVSICILVYRQATHRASVYWARVIQRTSRFHNKILVIIIKQSDCSLELNELN